MRATSNNLNPIGRPFCGRAWISIKTHPPRNPPFWSPQPDIRLVPGNAEALGVGYFFHCSNLPGALLLLGSGCPHTHPAILHLVSFAFVAASDASRRLREWPTSSINGLLTHPAILHLGTSARSTCAVTIPRMGVYAPSLAFLASCPQEGSFAGKVPLLCHRRGRLGPSWGALLCSTAS